MRFYFKCFLTFAPLCIYVCVCICIMYVCACMYACTQLYEQANHFLQRTASQSYAIALVQFVV
jgi:hypothetical protein